MSGSVVVLFRTVKKSLRGSGGGKGEGTRVRKI